MFTLKADISLIEKLLNEIRPSWDASPEINERIETMLRTGDIFDRRPHVRTEDQFTGERTITLTFGPSCELLKLVNECRAAIA